MKSAFVIVDVQGTWARDNPRTTKAIRHTADRAREQMPVIWVFKDWLPPDAPYQAASLALSRRFNVFSQGEMEDDRAGAVIKPERQDWILPKEEMSLFANPDAEGFFHEQGIERLVTVGFMTGQCVYFSARDGVRRGFKVDVVSDLTADRKDCSLPYTKERFAEIGAGYAPKAALGL